MTGIDYCLHEKMGVKTVMDGLVLPSKDTNPGGIVEGSTFVENTSLHRGKGGIYPYEDSAVKYVDEDVAFLGMFFDCWGHSITDCLSHLWFVNDEELTEKFRSLKWIYIGYEKIENLNANFRCCLRRLGIEESRLTYVSSVTKFRKIYIPDDCFRCDPKTGDRFYSVEYRSLIDRIISGIAPSTERKVYFSRTAFANNKDFGEEVIENAFSKSGYTIIHPEKLTLEEQISVLQGCDEFATTEGSISHNAIFLRDGAQCDIVRKSTYVNHYQIAINQMRNLKVRFFDGFCHNLEYEKDKMEYGPFLMRIDKSLAQFLGCHQTCPIKQYLILKTKRLMHRIGLSELFRKFSN